jgi:hypothetical protein
MPFATEERFIDAAEAKLGVRLPTALRARLLSANGGEVELDDDVWRLHPVFDTSDRKRNTRTANDIVRETASAREWRGFPATAVAIAGNGSGDFLVLLPSVEDPSTLDERIYVWNHETTKVELVAERFDEIGTR